MKNNIHNLAQITSLRSFFLHLNASLDSGNTSLPLRPAFFAFFISVLLITSCQKLDWDNPMDPKTGVAGESWKPGNLTVTALNDQEVRLNWIGSEDRVEGYRLYRMGP